MPASDEMTVSARRYQRRIIGHGALVMVVALFAGFGLMFALLGEIAIWPVPWTADVQIPGTPRGWRAAHVGGLTNGVMMVAVALCLPLLAMTEGRQRWVCRAMIFTGWANTVFYLFGNLAPNRGLSGGDNAFGPGTAAGLIAYVPAAIATVVTISALAVVAMAALREPA
ncbi:MAG: hypothetical protein R3190_02435 [Thermoanaerobaculia bacterium]|nr:hypothetical protein [Thermoanaerobaculia bacterium]